MDTLTPEDRSEVMRRVRSKDTKPEKQLRSALHRAGFRFRLHRRSLPGAPDIVFPGRRKVIFMHGCFWHSHRCRESSRLPQTNRLYWITKLEATKRRDARNRCRLAALGWRSMTVWECELRAMEKVLKRATRFLEKQ